MKPKNAPPSPSGPSTELRPCVFLDRDGTVSREAGYINHPERIELLPGSATAIRQLNERGVLAILTTNQAGVGRGYFSEEVLHKIHDRLRHQLSLKRARLDAIYYAPTHPDAKIERYRRDDNMRKPGIGMVQQACREFPIDLARSYVVGDKSTDIDFARNAGVKAVFVLSGYGLGEYEHQRHEWKHQPDHVAEDLREAVSWILEDLRLAALRPAAALPEASASHNGSNGSNDSTQAKVLTWPQALDFVRRAREQGRSVVLANGCFDLIHGGHVSYLEAAAAEGDLLLVGINSDRSERELKGPGRPVVPEAERAELIAGMGAVDAVVLFDEPTCERLLRELHPDVHAKGTDYTADTVPEREIARELGIRVAITGDPKENASKNIIKTVRAAS